MEDYDLIRGYGFDYPIPDDKWIAQDSTFWDSLDIGKIKRYNFLGGESFYNKRHNEFIKRLNERVCQDVRLHTLVMGHPSLTTWTTSRKSG